MRNLLCLLASTMLLGAAVTAEIPDDPKAEALQAIREARQRIAEAHEQLNNAENAVNRLQNPTPQPPPPPPPPPIDGIPDAKIVCVQLPRLADQHPNWMTANEPVDIDGNGDLILYDPKTQTKTTLYDAQPSESCMDPQVTHDGQRVLFTLVSNIDHTNKRNHRDVVGRLMVYDTTTGKSHEIPGQPDTRININPSPLDDDKILFVSGRDVTYFSGGIHIGTQLFVINEDGSNLRKVGYLNLHGALHPYQLKDGRIMSSTGEGAMWRGDGQWGLWFMNPDGTDWGPLFSAFTSPTGLPFPYHFQTELRDGRIILTQYYKAKNYGTGQLNLFDPTTGFQSPENLFKPVGNRVITPDSPIKDVPAAADGGPAWGGGSPGKWTHPKAGPGGVGFYVVWTKNRTNAKAGSTDYLPSPQGVVAWVPNPDVDIDGLDKFEIILQDERYSFIQPVPLVPYKAIYGVDAPAKKPWLPQGNHPAIVKGEAAGIIGTDTVLVRESATEGKNEPWKAQGSDVAVGYENSDVSKMRFIGAEMVQNKFTSTTSFGNIEPERLKILGEIDLLKYDADGNVILDANGDPDTSFRAKLPANYAFFLQLLNHKGEALTTAQTWRMVRPGELHDNCRGCHAHWKPSQLEMAKTWAGLNPPHDLTNNRPEGFDYIKDIEPILEQHCNKCHESDDEPAAESLAVRISRPYGTRLDLSLTSPFRALDSELYQRLVTDDPEKRMPLNHPPLSDVEIGKVRKWLDTGMQDKNSHIDRQPPSLHIEYPRQDTAEAVDHVEFSALDSYALASVYAELDGVEILNLIEIPKGQRMFTVPLSESVTSGKIKVTAVDSSGNTVTHSTEF